MMQNHEHKTSKTTLEADAYLESLTALKNEFHRRGWDKPATSIILGQLAVHLCLFAVGAGLYFSAGALSLKTFGLLLAVAGSYGVGNNTHTASHNASSSNRAFNQCLTFFGYPLFLGMAATYWRHKHVAMHHQAPNVLGIDKDIDLSPYYAITESQVHNAKGWRRYWHSVQWLSLPFAIGLITIGMALDSWRYLAKQLLNNQKRRVSHWIDAGALVLHASAYITLVGIGLNSTDVLLFFLLRNVCLGYLFFVTFAPAHFPNDARCFSNDKSFLRDRFALVTHTSLNFHAGTIARFFCAGLEYQIEHHLFPEYDHTRYPQMSGIVSRYCHHHGYPYHTLNWFRGVRQSLAVFRHPKPVTTHWTEANTWSKQ